MARQPAIIRRIDAALAKMDAAGAKPRAICLVQDDYEAFADLRTKQWRDETGSTAYLWPCSYGDIPLINERGLAKLEIPVREAKSRSIVYSTHGVGFRLPRRAP